MRVLIVSQVYWPEDFRINDLARGLVERGHEVTVLTGSPNYPGGRIFPGYGFFNKRESHQGIEIIRVPLIPRGAGGSLRLILNYLSFMVSATLLGPLLCRSPFDAIFVFQVSPITVGIPAIFLGYLKRAPVLMWVLDLWPESVAATSRFRSSWLIKGVDLLVRFIYKHCDRILFASKGFASSIQTRGVPSSKLSYFPNWVEPIQSATYKPQVQLPEGFNVLFAGNVGVAQDFGTILQAAELLKEHSHIHWVILGEGRCWDWVKNEVEARKLTHCFHLLGRFPPDTMPGFFAQAEALLVTLQRDPTFALTLPGKVQSYMSCGRPLLAALDGEGAALIKDTGAGFVVPSGDAQGLADIVQRLHALPAEERTRMGQAAKRYCEDHFDRDRLFTGLLGELEALAAGRSDLSGEMP